MEHNLHWQARYDDSLAAAVLEEHVNGFVRTADRNSKRIYDLSNGVVDNHRSVKQIHDSLKAPEAKSILRIENKESLDLTNVWRRR